MGKIINILGPHGVGKTTLQKYINDNLLGIVIEGFILPLNGLDLSDPNIYIEYEKKYIEQINEQNKKIKNSLEDGYVIRSIEEVEYFLKTHKPSIDEYEIRKLINDESNILCDLIIYLDSKKEVLDERISKDIVRDQIETNDWYLNDFEKYDLFWKKYKRINIIDTTNLSVEEVYDEIVKLLNNICK